MEGEDNVFKDWDVFLSQIEYFLRSKKIFSVYQLICYTFF